MSGAVIGKGAKIKRAIIGEGAHISEGVELRYRRSASRRIQ